MTLSLVTAPAVEPVSIDDVVAHLRLDPDQAGAESGKLAILIQSARESVEAHTHRALITQTWDLHLDAWWLGSMELPRAPLASVSSVTYIDTDGTSQTWSSSNYVVRAVAGPRAQPGRIWAAYGVTYPSVQSRPEPITVRFVAGYGLSAASVPAALRSAILILIAEQYARREDSIVGTTISQVPDGVRSILAPYVVTRWP